MNDLVKPWAQNSVVYVNVNANDFTQAVFDATGKPVFDNYNAASGAGGNASGVRFCVTRTTVEIVSLTAVNGNAVAVNNSNKPNAYQINRRSPLSDSTNDYGLTAFDNVGSTSSLHAAYTEINAGIGTDGLYEAMKKTLAHEISHTFGLDHCNPARSPLDICSPDKSMMTLPPDGTPFNNSQFGTTGPTGCDNENIKAAGNYNTTTVNQPTCPVNARGGDLAGTFGNSSIPSGGYELVTHEMHVTSYNPSTGAFTLKYIDYYTTKQSYSSPTVTSPANPAPNKVVDNTDPCFNADGSVMNVTIGANAYPTFNCTFTKTVPLTYSHTEVFTLPTGNSADRKVYTENVPPGSGIPYMHFIGYNAFSNTYAYAHN